MCMVKLNNLLSLSGMAVASLVVLLCLGAGPLNAREKKDMILVLDTSLSMAGYGGKNVFPEVKKSLGKFIDQLGKATALPLSRSIPMCVYIQPFSSTTPTTGYNKKICVGCEREGRLDIYAGNDKKRSQNCAVA